MNQVGLISGLGNCNVVAVPELGSGSLRVRCVMWYRERVQCIGNMSHIGISSLTVLQPGA